MSVYMICVYVVYVGGICGACICGMCVWVYVVWGVHVCMWYVCAYLWYLYVGCLCICVCSLLRHSFTKLLQLKVSLQFPSQDSNLQILVPQLLKRLRSSILHGDLFVVSSYLPQNLPIDRECKSHKIFQNFTYQYAHSVHNYKKDLKKSLQKQRCFT